MRPVRGQIYSRDRLVIVDGVRVSAVGCVGRIERHKRSVGFARETVIDIPGVAVIARDPKLSI